MGLGPFDLPGGQFLMLYGVLLAAAIVAGVVIARVQRPAGQGGATVGEAELAMLAGGETRYAEAVVARLMAQDALAIANHAGTSTREFTILQPGGGSDVAERAVLSLGQTAEWTAIVSALQPYAAQAETRLVQRGLLVDADSARTLRLRQTLPLLAVLAFGVIKLAIGLMRDRPVTFLVMLLILTAVLAALRYAAYTRATRAGEASLATVREQHDRLKRAPMEQEAGMAVALFGTTVLAGSALADLHLLRMPSSGDSSSSWGSDSSCGGDSGCSSGCGGCGGD